MSGGDGLDEVEEAQGGGHGDGSRGGGREGSENCPPRAPLLEIDFCAIRRLVRRTGPHAGQTGGTAGAAGPHAELHVLLEMLSKRLWSDI